MKHSKSRFPYIYELFVWLVYVCMYKYDHYLESWPLPLTGENFPYLQLMFYAIGTTLYVIPFYRWLAPLLLRQKKYLLFFFTVVLYFGFVSKLGTWLISLLFYKLNPPNLLQGFYKHWYLIYQSGLLRLQFPDLRIIVTDLIAFVSLTFLWYAFENERKKHLLEKDNLQLQLETLKAQLHPHFLFNTLNSIYGMSLTGSKETPAFILRLSDMMRYVLYDCRHHQVALEKDIGFLVNYLEMEKKRYPEAAIQFTVTGATDKKTIAPLLLIPFVENSFKHGSHRFAQKGAVQGSLEVHENHLTFRISNDHADHSRQEHLYGGIGIENVKKRLELYYPGKHKLTISRTNDIFEVDLQIFF